MTSFSRRLPLSVCWSSRRWAGSPGPCYRGKKAIPQFRNRLNIGAGGPGLLQNLAQERDLTGEAAFFDEAVGPQRRHQLFLSHQMAGVAHQQQQSLEGFGRKGQNLVVAAQNAFARHQPERAEGISLRLRRLGTGFGACRDGDSTRRTLRRPLRFHQRNIKSSIRTYAVHAGNTVPVLVRTENGFSDPDLY